MVANPIIENVKVEKKPNVIAQRVLTKPPNPFMAKPKAKRKSLPKSQRGPQTQHFCHHYGIRGHIRPNCHKLQALKNTSSQRPRGQRNGKGNLKQSKGREVEYDISDVMKFATLFWRLTLMGHSSCELTQKLSQLSGESIPQLQKRLRKISKFLGF